MLNPKNLLKKEKEKEPTPYEELELRYAELTVQYTDAKAKISELSDVEQTLQEKLVVLKKLDDSLKKVTADNAKVKNENLFNLKLKSENEKKTKQCEKLEKQIKSLENEIEEVREAYGEIEFNGKEEEKNEENGIKMLTFTEQYQNSEKLDAEENDPVLEVIINGMYFNVNSKMLRHSNSK